MIAPTISGRQGRCREAGSGGSRKQNCGLRNTKHVRGYPSRASWQQAAKPNAIKDLGSKRDKRAEKVNVLTWGDLLSGFQSNPDCEVRLRQQGSAEVIVPIFFREGLNIKRMSKMSSSQDEHGRPNASDRGTTSQTKRVKPVGVVERVEPSSARDRRKSSARVSAPLLVNRRMRTRMSGGVRGSG